ncbi:DUF992 domain-containing protein [Paracoccaceae bacterium GXU_MW_L88]
MKALLTTTIFGAALGLAACSNTNSVPGEETDVSSNQVQGEIEAGTLSCDLTGGTNAIVVSEKTYQCVFDFAGDEGQDQVYTGTINKIGVDLTAKSAESLTWVVATASEMEWGDQPGLLAGNYVGVSADAALGLGAGARVLVGGSSDAITLQPASTQTSEGLGIAAGVEQFTLEYVGAVANQ